MTSEEFADFALEKAGVALLPGNNFGEYGEGFVRLCYVNTLENIERAIGKLAEALKGRQK
jgi:aspartate/methionine/tyrosine aminotransferase